MTHNGHLDARTLHARLTHPVIDSDGHWPVRRATFRRIGDEAAVATAAAAVLAQPATRH